MSKTLVTVGTDGFRDYVEVSDGRTLNLGSISVLKLVASLVDSPAMCRLALDSFLKDGKAVIHVDLSKLEKLLQPKRSRWAGKDLIPSLLQGLESGGRVASDQDPVSSKFSALIRAFNQLHECPSPEAVESMKVATSEFASLVKSGRGPDFKHELEEFLQNDTGILRKKKQVIRAILQKPKYDHNFAKRKWAEWVDDAVAEFSEEFDEDGKELFPKPLRNELVEEIADREKQLIDEGEYSRVKMAEENGMEKEAADEFLVNEGLVHLVAAKTSQAFDVVTGSEKKGSEVAKQDLQTISARLEGITKSASLGNPSLRTELLDLAKKADQVRSHFER